MKHSLINIKNYLLQKFYKWILKPIFFRTDPEIVHNHMTSVGNFLGKYSLTRKLTNIIFGYSHPSLNQKILGISFKNPIGLSAGFDKNAILVDIIPAVGFGFMEVGSITGEYCEGNPKPRLWRLKKSKSLAAYCGLKNIGCERIANNLVNKKISIPLGINIAKTNCGETVDTD